MSFMNTNLANRLIIIKLFKIGPSNLKVGINRADKIGLKMITTRTFTLIGPKLSEIILIIITKSLFLLGLFRIL